VYTNGSDVHDLFNECEGDECESAYVQDERDVVSPVKKDFTV